MSVPPDEQNASRVRVDAGRRLPFTGHPERRRPVVGRLSPEAGHDGTGEQLPATGRQRRFTVVPVTVTVAGRKPELVAVEPRRVEFLTRWRARFRRG